MKLPVLCTGLFPIVTAFILSGCEGKADNSYTLYRNSPLMLSERVHWATFDAKEEGDYNRGNCLMASRLLNANVEALAKAEQKEPAKAGFWCEAGSYKAEGSVPSAFERGFPANSDSRLSW